MSIGNPAYYDAEAGRYDDTRGGLPRARSAAAAVASLVPGGGTALDVAGGTGIVSAELARLGFSVLVADLSIGMLSVAASRLPGRVVAGSADRLPVRDSSVDLVTVIWLLHLLAIPVADRVIGEASRVLRPGGHLVTTVDKDLAHGRVRRTNADHGERVAAVARRQGLESVGGASFVAETRWPSAQGGQVFAVSAFRAG
ncbi:MAG TPA: class I SAM-dependent methyltransferase [Nocardioidaceae bacterium]|nr:class I SAM-dependent methyltransferase [Nocardioidaceae bacterium]